MVISRKMEQNLEGYIMGQAINVLLQRLTETLG
jgi:hypothetical protein